MSKFNIIFVIIALLIGCTNAAKMVCYYDAASHLREGNAQMSLQQLEPASNFCSYLVYGYAGISPDDFQLRSLNKDLDVLHDHYRAVTNFRRTNPHLLVLLSVGGGRDNHDAALPNPYLTLLENQAHRTTFVNSAVTLLKTYDFDGLDLAWQFPPNPPRLQQNKIKQLWSNFKGWFTGPKVVDEHAEEHKLQFATLVQELKDAFRGDGLILTVTMMPHVDAATFIDIPKLMPHVDYVNLGSYDFETPERSPKVADHVSPLYEMFERDPTHNVDFQVEYWLNNSAPANKLNVGIAAYGRSWIMTPDSGITGYPPIEKTEGPAPGGKQTRIPGVLSWPEICEKLQRDKERDDEDAPLRKVGDPRQRYGTYAYRSADVEGTYGLWVGYEEPSTAAIKAGYVFARGLGGVALFDLSMDDFRGECAGEKFPILRSIKFKL